MTPAVHCKKKQKGQMRWTLPFGRARCPRHLEQRHANPYGKSVSLLWLCPEQGQGNGTSVHWHSRESAKQGTIGIWHISNKRRQAQRERMKPETTNSMTYDPVMLASNLSEHVTNWARDALIPSMDIHGGSFRKFRVCVYCMVMVQEKDQMLSPVGTQASEPSGKNWQA